MFENVYISQVILEIIQINLQATHTAIREKIVNREKKNSNLQFLSKWLRFHY